MSTLTDALAASMPADGDTAWGTELRNFMRTVDYLAQPSNTYFVSPTFTAANISPYGAGSDRRHFDTIQGAIDQIEASANNHLATILVFPATYTEELTITKSVHVCGVASGYATQGGKCELNGNHSAPTITVNPAAGEWINVVFSNFKIGQDDSTYGGVTTAWPFWVDVNDQGAGNYGSTRNRIVFHNCDFKQDNLPDASDVFTYGIALDGYNQLILHQTQLRFPDDNDFTNPIWIHGNNAQSKQGQLHMKRCEVIMSGSSGHIIDFDDSSSGIVLRSTFTRSSLALIRTFGATGSNSCSGLNSSTDFGDLANVGGYSALFTF